MILTDEQKKILFDKDCYSMVKALKNQDIDTLQTLNNITSQFMQQFGIPYSKRHIDINSKRENLNGQYLPAYNQIVLCIKSNPDNFKLVYTLFHESTHMLQYFLINNGISRNTIDDLTLQKYQKMCRKFYNDKNIQVDESMLQKFKEFVKTEPLLENDKMKMLIQDLHKYHRQTDRYYNNISEIMANHFAITELKSIVKTNELTKDQYKEIKKVADNDEISIDKIKPEKKILHSVIQNIFTTPQSHIRHLVSLMKTKLSPIVHNVKEFMDDIQYEASENAKDINQYLQIGKKSHHWRMDIDDLLEEITQHKEQNREEQEESLADLVLTGNFVPNIRTAYDAPVTEVEIY